MTLTPEQKQTVATWVAAGDNLSVVQKKLSEQFKISLTYMDVRFLVDDLGLELKNAAPKADASDVTKAPAASTALPRAPATNEPGDGDLPGDDLADSETADPTAAPIGAGSLTLELDRIMRPGTAVSGTVTFSDGVSGKWALDHHGRLMLDTAQKGYQPSAPDVQAFQRELQSQLQRQGY
ncbi:MAG TPA: hypothetical protein VGM64_05600 [Lacunisphaera sp.]|jgi:hypothetical protein